MINLINLPTIMGTCTLQVTFKTLHSLVFLYYITNKILICRIISKQMLHILNNKVVQCFLQHCK